MSHVICHMSHVMFYMAHVACHMYFLFIFLGQSDGGSRWRVFRNVAYPVQLKQTRSSESDGRSDVNDCFDLKFVLIHNLF